MKSQVKLTVNAYKIKSYRNINFSFGFHPAEKNYHGESIATLPLMAGLKMTKADKGIYTPDNLIRYINGDYSFCSTPNQLEAGQFLIEITKQLDENDTSEMVPTFKALFQEYIDWAEQHDMARDNQPETQQEYDRTLSRVELELNYAKSRLESYLQKIIEASNQTTNPRDLITFSVAIAKYQVSRPTLQRRVDSGKLKSYRKFPKDEHLIRESDIAERYPSR